MTSEERLALIMKPFPVIRIATAKGHSQAPDWARTKQAREDAEDRYTRDNNS